jgi:hypothetical protein
MSNKARLIFVTYSGMTIPLEETAYRHETGDLRQLAARKLRLARRQGRPAYVVKRGECWEFETPDDAHMIGDRDGMMYLSIPDDGMADDEPEMDEDFFEEFEDFEDSELDE